MNTAYRNKDDAYKKKIDVRGGGGHSKRCLFLVYNNIYQ